MGNQGALRRTLAAGPEGGAMTGRFTPSRFFRQYIPVGVAESTIDYGANELVARSFNAERRTVALGWYDPIGLQDAGHTYGLTGAMFADRQYGFLYSYLVTVADLGRVPDVDEAVAVAAEVDVDLEAFDLYRLQDLIVDEWPSDNLDDLVAAVVHHHARRQAAHKHFKAYAEAVYGTGIEFDVVPRRRIPVANPRLPGTVLA